MFSEWFTYSCSPRSSQHGLACHTDGSYSLYKSRMEKEKRRQTKSLQLCISYNKRSARQKVVPLWQDDTALDRCVFRGMCGWRILQALSHHWHPITCLVEYTGCIYILLYYKKRKWKEFEGTVLTLGDVINYSTKGKDYFSIYSFIV